VPRDNLISDDAAEKKELAQIELVSAEDPRVRRRWIESLSAEQKAQLAAQAKRFENIRVPGEQIRLRQLEREIGQADDSQRLRQTLVAYGQWLNDLTAGQQQQLRDDMAEMSADEQVDLVRQFVRREKAEASHQLSDEDAATLRRELLALANERQSALLREMRRRGEGDRARQLEGPRGALMILTRELMQDGGDKTRERLTESLSPGAREHLDGLNGWRRRLQLWNWVRDSLQPKLGPNELERFFAEKLDNDTRERLLNMPADEMRPQLERLYFAAEFGRDDAASWWNELREARGERGRPDGRRDELRPDRQRRERDRDRGPGPPSGDRFERERMPLRPDTTPPRPDI
jgi:hypothetical protein